ncbi:MAG: TrkH family potassium uptake protein [Methanobrevibacter sp.]|nr:TrkH family potassium uptake protein [Methanobrevibacter sp.]
MKYILKKDIYIVAHYLGKVMQGVGIVTLIPLIIALIYHEPTYLGFLIPSLLSLGIGTLFSKIKLKNPRVRLKHGMMISSLSWLWAGLIGALIMIICLDISFIDAFFENISAWTGSGVTMFADVEILPKSILFLRSIEQWIGGLGVVVIVIGVLIHSGTAADRLYKSEAREERIKPSIANTLKKIMQIYLIFTVLGITLFLIAGMPLFDSINNTFSAIATAGMSIKNLNMGYYNNNIYYLISLFLMILGATSFLLHYKAIKTKGVAIFKDMQFKAMIFLIGVSFLLIYLATNMMPMDIIYHVISAITTTGANINSSAQTALWSPFMKIIIIVLMFIGGSAGSTVGAVKLVRVIAILKGIYLNIINIISPKGRVVSMKISDHIMREDEIREASSYVSLYLIFILIGWLVLVFYGYNPMNSLFEIVSIQGNVGLSTGITSPSLGPIIKITMIFNMWIGRLEIIPVLVIIKSFFEVFKR